MSSGWTRVPGRDRVRLSAQEKQQAAVAAAEKKVEYDNERLLGFLRSARNELQGLRLIHLHLSLLREREQGHQILVRTILNELTQKASHLQIFLISNGDVVVVYKGLKLTSITEVCQKIEQLLLAKTGLTGPNPYRDNSLYSIMELSLNFINVMNFIEELVKDRGLEPRALSKPSITLEELGKLERSMGMFDLSPFLFNQAIVNIAAERPDDVAYYELYISIKQLEERLCPAFDLTANRWLFNYFTANLDQSVLRALGHGPSFMRGRRIGININLPTVISTGFIKFDEILPSEFRGSIVLEISKVDLIENFHLFFEVAEFAQEKQFKLAIDGLNQFLVGNIDLEYLGCDYAKIFWSPDLLEMEANFRNLFLRRIAEQSRCRFVLCRCDTVSSLLFAERTGIQLVQGRAVDNILRKGVTVRDAIQAASTTDPTALGTDRP